MTDSKAIGGCWALVPIKARMDCKSRLTNVPAEVRKQLVELMLENVIDALLSANAIERVGIVTPEPSQIPPGVVVLRDEGGGLNEALNSARNKLRTLGATELIILHADLPLVRGIDIDRLIGQGRRSGFALASDTMGIGTNALYLPLHLPFAFRFGAHSCDAHLRQARQLGLKPAIVYSDGLQFDIDNQEDLKRLKDSTEGRFQSFFTPTRTPHGCPPFLTSDRKSAAGGAT